MDDGGAEQRRDMSRIFNAITAISLGSIFRGARSVHLRPYDRTTERVL
jgi:hypothetical protein